MTTEEKPGMESYLYKRGMKCCINNCSVFECPEPICAEEFPGGVNSYRKYRKMRNLLQSGFEIEAIKAAMGLDKFTFSALFKKSKWLSP